MQGTETVSPETEEFDPLAAPSKAGQTNDPHATDTTTKLAYRPATSRVVILKMVQSSRTRRRSHHL